MRNVSPSHRRRQQQQGDSLGWWWKANNQQQENLLAAESTAKVVKPRIQRRRFPPSPECDLWSLGKACVILACHLNFGECEIWF